jgi:GTP-binding protein EngB required for normal cell division/uncharacterized protein (DUF697 family)
MKLDRLIRGFLAVAIVLVVLAVVAVLLFVTESALNVWERLSEAPAWFWGGYVLLIVSLLGGGFWIIWKLLIPRRRRATNKPARPADEGELRGALTEAETAGIDVSFAKRELDRLAERRAGGELYISMFGDISTGKSSLIAALLPDADVEVSPVGGSTRTVRHYRWTGLLGDTVIVSDVPGTGLALDEAARDEARRAHVVVYVCDAELTRHQMADLDTLAASGKPLVVAMNKSDRFDEHEREAIMARIRQHLDHLAPNAKPSCAGAIPVVAVRAGGSEEITRVGADGLESVETRMREPQLEALSQAIRTALATDRATLEQLRDRDVLRLAEHRLETSRAQHRRERADELVRSYTRKAVVGALAAVSPGTDILIQGYLGTAMVKALCELYDVPARDLDIEQFLDLSQSHVGRTAPIVLALTGNAFKAFPGAGTLAGGALHAAAYGFIFDALGRSLAKTLDTRGELAPAVAAQRFRDSMSEQLESRATRMVKLALKASSDTEPGEAESEIDAGDKARRGKQRSPGRTD